MNKSIIVLEILNSQYGVMLIIEVKSYKVTSQHYHFKNSNIFEI